MLGTVRIENLPMTLAGMTVFAPGVEKAPSMPCRESEGMRQRAISVFFLSSKMVVLLPSDWWSVSIVKAMPS